MYVNYAAGLNTEIKSELESAHCDMVTFCWKERIAIKLLSSLRQTAILKTQTLLSSCNDRYLSLFHIFVILNNYPLNTVIRLKL